MQIGLTEDVYEWINTRIAYGAGNCILIVRARISAIPIIPIDPAKRSQKSSCFLLSLSY